MKANDIIEPYNPQSPIARELKLMRDILTSQTQEIRVAFGKRAERVQRTAEKQRLDYIMLLKDDKEDLGLVLAAGVTRADALVLIRRLVTGFDISPEALPGMLRIVADLQASPEGVPHQPVHPP